MKIIESSEILKSLTRTGSQKFWQVHICTNGNQYYTQSSYWQINKKGEKSIVQFSDPYLCTSKNINKKNETTPKDQAYLEFNAMIKKQRDKGYICDGETSKILPLPMLAQKFSERSHALKWPVYVQPKLNGQRMLYDGEKGWSRGGKLIIPEVIQHLQFCTNGWIIDGELLLPDNVLLQKTMSAIKKFNPDLSSKLLYFIYDVIDPNNIFVDRFNILKTFKLPKNVIITKTDIAHDIGEVMTFHNEVVKMGYEGTIVRNNNEGYEIGHRSNQLQKYKDFIDDEFQIVNVIEGDGRFKGSAIFTCKNKNGREFNCTPEGNMSYRQDLFKNKNKHIGKMLTIRFQELSKDNIPIFPVGVCIRDE